MAPIVPPVQLPLTVKIPGGLNPERTLYFDGEVRSVAQWFEINLRCGAEDTADIAFVLQLNFHDEYANFTTNSWVNGVWESPKIHERDKQIRIAARNDENKIKNFKKIQEKAYKRGVMSLTFIRDEERASTSRDYRRLTIDSVKYKNETDTEKAKSASRNEDDNKVTGESYNENAKTNEQVNDKNNDVEAVTHKVTKEATEVPLKESQVESSDDQNSAGGIEKQENTPEFESINEMDDVKATNDHVRESLDSPNQSKLKIKEKSATYSGYVLENRFKMSTEDYRKYEAQYKRKYETFSADNNLNTNREEETSNTDDASKTEVDEQKLSKETNGNAQDLEERHEDVIDNPETYEKKPRTSNYFYREKTSYIKLQKVKSNSHEHVVTNGNRQAEGRRPDDVTDSQETHDKKPRGSNYFYREKTSYIVPQKTSNSESSNNEMSDNNKQAQDAGPSREADENSEVHVRKHTPSNYYHRQKTNYDLPNVAVKLQRVLTCSKESKLDEDHSKTKVLSRECGILKRKSDDVTEELSGTRRSVLLGTKYEYLIDRFQNEYLQEVDLIGGDQFNMTLECLENGYIVTLNEELFCVYPHIVSYPRVTHVMVDGDLDLHGLEVAGGKGPDRTMVMDLYPELVWKSTVTVLTDDNFNSYVMENHLPWMVVVYTAWCPACLKMRSHWEEAAESVPEVKFGVIDADRNEELTDTLKVTYYPMIFFFHEEKILKRKEVYIGPRVCDSLVAYAKHKSEGRSGMPPTVKLTRNIPKTIRKLREKHEKQRELISKSLEEADTYRSWHKFECGEKTYRHVGVDIPHDRVCSRSNVQLPTADSKKWHCGII